MKNRRTGFTLIELLIVTVVIVTLMGIVFRLAGLGSSARAKNVTISRLQRVENALSGYYAAFGSYPPVPLHGSRDYTCRVGFTDLQDGDPGSGETDFTLDKFRRQVEAACRAQPVAARYPYGEWAENYIKSVSDMCLEYYKRGMAGQKEYSEWAKDKFSKPFTSMSQNLYGTDLRTQTDWQEVRVFQFGLMSFLLPRYLFMLNSRNEYYDDCAQWTKNNRLFCDFRTGTRVPDWKTVRKYLGIQDNGKVDVSGAKAEAGMITNLPSQAVTARWMPNFKGIVHGGGTFYGIDTNDGIGGGAFNSMDSSDFQIFSREADGNGERYVLDGMTVWDGWNRELYYYSEAPYQSYRLWSAGPDGRTFPPWADLDTLSEADRKRAAGWMADDIVHLSN